MGSIIITRITRIIQSIHSNEKKRTVKFYNSQARLAERFALFILSPRQMLPFQITTCPFALKSDPPAHTVPLHLPPIHHPSLGRLHTFINPVSTFISNMSHSSVPLSHTFPHSSQGMLDISPQYIHISQPPHHHHSHCSSFFQYLAISQKVNIQNQRICSGGC
jgi:hypothetical protein